MGGNSICCSRFKKWIDKSCSGVTGRLKEDVSYKCSKCAGGGTADDAVDEHKVSLEEDSSFECVHKKPLLGYLGDTLVMQLLRRGFDN